DECRVKDGEVSLTGVQRLKAGPHDLHVLLRHRPRSIASTGSGGQADGSGRITADPHLRPGPRPGAHARGGPAPVTRSTAGALAVGLKQGHAPELRPPGGRAAWVAATAVAALGDQAATGKAGSLHRPAFRHAAGWPCTRCV